MTKFAQEPWAKCLGCGCTDDNACNTDEIPERVCRWIIVDYIFNIGICTECWDSLEEFREAHSASVNARKHSKGEVDGTDQRRYRDT